MKRNIWIMGLLMFAGAALAQGDVTAVASTNAASSGGFTSGDITLWGLIKVGGWCMWPLGLCSFLGVTLVIQNFFSLRAKRLLHTEMMPDLLELMLQKKIKTALIYCRKNPSMFTNTFAAGLERVIDGVTDFSKVDESVKEASVEQMARLLKPIDMLSIIGTSSPMIGLLGTVSGMIKAFQTMGTVGMGKPEVLAQNIGEALVTTMTGLIIAIPVMVFYFIFKKGFAKTMATLGRNLSVLFDALETGKRPAAFLDLEALEKMGGQ